MTWRQTCEAVAAWLTYRTGRPVTWRQVWEISSTGELWPVSDLYRTMMADDGWLKL